MQQQLYLHIGDCKTGSTIIQSMLARQDCVPQGLRLFYPGAPPHGALARSLGDRPDLYPQRWNRAARRLSQTDWDVAVLSTELFEFIQPAAVLKALNNHLPQYSNSVKVIVYVRPHAGRVMSQFAENLKLGHETGSLETFVGRFLKAGRLRYAERLNRWKTVFGDRLIVRPFVRDRLIAGDVRQDFLPLILGDTPYTLADSGQDNNASLLLPDLALMRLLQRRFAQNSGVPMDSRVAFGKHFGKLLRDVAPVTPTEKMHLPQPLYDLLLKDCMADAEIMDATWFGGPCFVPELIKAGQTVIDSPQSLEAQDYFGPDTLRLMQAWADLIVRQMTDEPREFSARIRQPGLSQKPAIPRT